MSKVVIIGIDGLDPLLIDKWKDSLPNFRGLYNNVSDITIESTFPPDSICAWASIFTGENPAEHGLIENIDYLSKKSSDQQDKSAHIKGKTFWDIVGDKGRTVCVINPFIAYPSWDVNGTMISGPVFEGGKTSTYPESIISEYKLPLLGGMVDFPEEKNLGPFLNSAKELTVDLGDVSLEIYKDKHPDLFFLTFLTLDRIKHFIWRFTDKNDVYYPGKNSYENVIKDFYIMFDEIVGSFLRTMDDDSVLMVISDHGHRRRCSYNLNLNEILRKKGYLSTAGSGPSMMLKKCVERAKVGTLTSLSNWGLQDWIYKIAKFIPHRKALKKSTYLIDQEGSPVSLSSVCGTNPYGGLDIKTSDDMYERLRDSVIDELLNINKVLGKNIIKWVKKRELIYSGRFEKRLPDILFELDEEYGVGMDLYIKSVTRNYSHKKISGGHKREAALLVHDKPGIAAKLQRPSSIIDLKEYILRICTAEKNTD